MLDQVAGKEHAGLDTFALQVVDDPVAGEAGTFPDGEQKTEPGRIGVLGRLGQDEAISQVGQPIAQQPPVPFAGLDEAGEFLQLGAADGGLHVGDLQVVAEVGVDVLVVVAEGQLAELLAEAVAAGVVPARTGTSSRAPSRGTIPPAASAAVSLV